MTTNCIIRYINVIFSTNGEATSKSTMAITETRMENLELDPFEGNNSDIVSLARLGTRFSRLISGNYKRSRLAV